MTCSVRVWSRPGGTLAAMIVAGALALPRDAQALEPLAYFLEGARGQNLDALEAKVTLEQRDEEATAAWYKLLPTVTASAQYTKNQYPGIARVPNPDGSLREVVVVAENQLDGTLSASVPVVDVGAWERIGVARQTTTAAKLRTAATALDVQRAVARDYYQLVAAEAVVAAAKRTLDAAERTRDYVTSRQAAGFTSELEVKRAAAEVERNKQSVAEAEYQVAVARRSLETATGRVPGPGAPELTASLEPEAPLATWLAAIDTLPSVNAASADAKASERNASATRLALVPTLTANAQERFTNAPGFGQQPYYQLSAVATWKLDATVFANAAAQDAQASAARIRETRARWAARDTVHNVWHEIESLRTKCTAAREQVAASSLAVKLAKQKYLAGTATFLDVTTAERDLFQAEVLRIQADASLLFARASLRTAAGRWLDAERSTP